MKSSRGWGGWCATAILLHAAAGSAAAQAPNHPIITEIYSDPAGTSDGPVGRDSGNLHQEFIELYLPPCADLDVTLNCSALNLTFYEVEGDHSSSGLGLVNYRFDLPTMCVLSDPAGCAPGALQRPPSGVVVLGWVDYVGDPPVGLAGTPDTRVGLVNGGITEADDYVFMAINGAQFDGTTNFPIPAAESLIDLPGEASTGVVQNGSSAYLLVNRDSPGYVELCDDQHSVDCAAGSDPVLPDDLLGLATPALLDACAANDDLDFDVAVQPYPACPGDPQDCVDLQTVLPEFGAFSLLVPQIPETIDTRPHPGQANGYARRFIDVHKTTETELLADDPAADASGAYRHTRNGGPFYATPGRVVGTASAPELAVAVDGAQTFEVLSQTTGRPGVLAANAGGNVAMDITATPGPSSDPAIMTFAPGLSTAGVAGQTLAFPSVAVTPAPGAAHGQSASAEVTLSAVNTVPGELPVVSPMQTATATVTVLDPLTGTDADGQPLEATVFLAVQGVAADAAVANEFLATDLAQFLAGQADLQARDTYGHVDLLLDPLTDLSQTLVVDPLVQLFPQDCCDYINPAGAPGTPDLLQTVLQSAEVQAGGPAYANSIATCACAAGETTLVKAVVVDPPDIQTFGGTFTPSELIHFADREGFVGSPRSGLTNASTTRTFEAVLLDTHLLSSGTLQTGASDDFGLVVEVGDTELGSRFVAGQLVFLSFSGGLQGADIDTLDVPSGGDTLVTLIYLDLDHLHEVLGIRTVRRLIAVDGSGDGEIDIVEAFNLGPLPPCPLDLSGDGMVDAFDLALLLGAWGPSTGHPADFTGDGMVDAFDLAQLLGGWGNCF